MHIFKIIFIGISIVFSQVIELKFSEQEKIETLEAASVEDYLDSLLKNDKSINHSFTLNSIRGDKPINITYIENHELINIDTIFIGNNEEVKRKTYESLLNSILNISSEEDIYQKIEHIQSSYKFLQNSIHFKYGKTKGGGVALLLDIIPEFENNISGLFGANKSDNGNLIMNGEIELYLENIWSTASNSLFHWKRLDEKSEIVSFLHYEPTLWNLPFGLQFSLDKELRDKEYILLERDFRIFSRPNRFGKWFFGSNILTITPTNIGYSIGLLNHESSSILLGVINDKRDHRWIPTNGSYWDISAIFGKQIEDKIANLRGEWSINNGAFWKINSFLSYHINIYAIGVWVENGNIHKGQKIRYGGVNHLRGYRDDQFISSSVCIPSMEFVSNVRKDIQLFTFMESAIQKEYLPYPLGFGIGIKQVSRNSIINATIGFGRRDPLSEAKIHIKFSSRL
ncbi:hypothetical protein EVA23_06325 [bacterium]|nr:MAG: hypothetical protein EVA23_06325 [bacterium]